MGVTTAVCPVGMSIMTPALVGQMFLSTLRLRAIILVEIFGEIIRGLLLRGLVRVREEVYGGAVRDNAPDLIRLAGTIFSGLGGDDNGGGDASGGFWGQEYQQQATEELDTRAAATYDEIKNILSDIRGLTGVSTPDAVQNYLTRFDETMDRFHTQGRGDVEGFSPHISDEYELARKPYRCRQTAI